LPTFHEAFTSQIRGGECLLAITDSRLDAIGDAFVPLNAAALFQRRPGNTDWFWHVEGERLGEVKILGR
jgi:hypothetical protein